MATTLKDIAREAGTTIATVSLALRGAPNVSTAKKEEILRIANSLGYRRNAHVSSLMRHIRQGRKNLPRPSPVALVFAHPERDARKRYVFIERRFQGMETRLAERGYRAQTFWYNDPDCSPERLGRILEARGIRGLVLSLFREYETGIDLAWDKFAVATQSDFILGPLIHRIKEDYFGNVIQAMTHLWKSGCRRIGMAHNHQHARSARLESSAAYHEFMLRARGTFSSMPAVCIPEDSRQWDEQFFMKWFRRVKPDAVLTFDWTIPEWLGSAGIRVPEDVSVAVLNRCPSAPEMSGVDPMPERLGAISVDLVVEQIESNEIGLPTIPRVITIPGLWKPGKTTRPSVADNDDSVKDWRLGMPPFLLSTPPSGQ
ncbi:MAG: LacI family DNA-binding transcriptional regulator [Verrucomicrobiota bacterium JB024]|nr:LacI family DNA-binding transcriptional regulator [Verrucomicrobiota bacterium JB024]